MKIYGTLLAGALVFASCSTDNVAKINGRFAGCSADNPVYLEKVLPGQQMIADSAKLTKKCTFAFTVKFADDQPTIYNLRYGNEVIPLMIAPGERVTVNSLANLSHNYTVEGSPQSQRIRELHKLLTEGTVELTRLWQEIGKAGPGERQQKYIDYNREYNRIKREHLAFIVSDPASLSSVYAIYQRLPGDSHLFSADNDFIYYRLVADSSSKYNPGSPYVAALRREVDTFDNSVNMAEMINNSIQSGYHNMIDLNLPDIYGNSHRLSYLRGDVIVVDFWTSSSPAARVNNAEYRKLYDQYAGSGFSVYQVAADTQKAAWIRAVQDQKLPWISVGDLQGTASPALRSYNVSRTPTNFILDRNGDIVARDLYGDQLAKKVKELL